MKISVCTLGICAALSGTGMAGQAGAANREGLLILTNLPTAPFPHPQRASGHTYKNKSYSAAEHYASNTVAIFVPKVVRPGSGTDFVVHLHGWNNNVQSAARQYQLCEQLVESGREAVLVLPQGPFNAPDSFAGKLEDTNGFKALMEDVVRSLQAQPAFVKQTIGMGRIILSCHSGGYRGVAAILARGGLTERVSEVWLFDGLYAETDKFMSWIESAPEGRLLNIYTEHGGTKEETESMMTALRKRSIRFASCREGELVPQILHSRQPVFIYTTMTHNQVLHMHHTFRQFLESSCLRQ